MGRMLEDFRVGEVFVSGEREITAEGIMAFAREFDPQYFHTDPEAAKDSLFGGLAASGWHTAAFSMRLVTECGLDVEGGLIGAAVEGLGWPRPTRPGERLKVKAEILEIQPPKATSRTGRGRMRVRIDTVNQHGEIAQSLTVSMTVPSRGPTMMA